MRLLLVPQSSKNREWQTEEGGADGVRISHSALMSEPKCIYKDNNRIRVEKCTRNFKCVSFFNVFWRLPSRGQEAKVQSLQDNKTCGWKRPPAAFGQIEFCMTAESLRSQIWNLARQSRWPNHSVAVGLQLVSVHRFPHTLGNLLADSAIVFAEWLVSTGVS